MTVQTTVTERGQTAVPARIRKALGLKPGQKLAWFQDGSLVYVMPVPEDPISAFRGSAKGEDFLADLLKYRREDARRT